MTHIGLREIHEEIVAIGTEDDRRLDRIEAALGQMHDKIDAICRAIGGPLTGLADQPRASAPPRKGIS